MCAVSDAMGAERKNTTKRERKMKNTMQAIEGMTFGVEIEYSGASRGKIAKAVAEVVGGAASYEGYVHGLQTWRVTDSELRKWNVVSDVSVSGSRDDCGGEVVTPILRMADIETLQKVVRAMRAAGAKVNGSCGSHVHVGAKDMTPKQLQNLVKIFYRQEELILRSAGVSAGRLVNFTRRMPDGFVEKIEKLRRPTMAEIADAYYEGFNNRYSHYCKARYRTLNLHNIWQGGKRTVEFRFFEGTLHAGEMRANILLALSLVAYARQAKGASGGARRAYNEASGKYDLRVLLLRLGWIGNEFKNPRKHMMKRLGGSTAWKDGAAHGRTAA